MEKQPQTKTVAPTKGNRALHMTAVGLCAVVALVAVGQGYVALGMFTILVVIVLASAL